MDEAISYVRTVHIGWCVAGGITYVGAFGHFTFRAVAADMNTVAIALDIATFSDPFCLDDVDALGKAIAPINRLRHQRLMLPGERGDAVQTECQRTGIPLSPSAHNRAWQPLSLLEALPRRRFS